MSVIPAHMQNPPEQAINFEAASLIDEIGKLIEQYAVNAAIEWAEQAAVEEPNVFMVDRCKEAITGKLRDYISEVQPYPYQWSALHAETYFGKPIAPKPTF